MKTATVSENPIIYIVDDNDDIRETLELLFESVDLCAESFGSAGEFLDAYPMGQSGCLIADVRMPEMSGLELQEELAKRGIDLPVIIITGYGDVEMAVNAMKAGAVDFIEKPYKEQELLDQVHRAISRSVRKRQVSGEEQMAREHLASLTPREREVLQFVVDGEPNKRIAHHLGVSEKTIEFHRSNIMKKLQATSLADLVRKTLIADSA